MSTLKKLVKTRQNNYHMNVNFLQNSLIEIQEFIFARSDLGIMILLSKNLVMGAMVAKLK